ncbi:hypothetical protein NA57DRAFT_81490 [Rhizodiscina lignyota]|uniref:GET complex, subunit GET2 n=1 Tax=Rhizodiscina lignyota TaxID=1504668 RepID=A0A9P4I5N6_9PEZI|nr:hypothetical protein NA57DRAFT_81490 [Rhizodiscina lignyota]
MADSSPASSDVPDNETPTQKQARLRRERRNAKIQGGGVDRLGKIMNVSGRTAPPVADSPSQSPKPSATPSGAPPPSAPQLAGQAPRQPMPMQMQDFDPDMSDPFNTPGAAGADPMMRMMQQMMAQANGQQQPQGAPGAMDEDPMFKLMQQMMGGEKAQEEQQPQPTSSGYVWRIVHAVFSILLALYVGISTAFTGSELARTQSQGLGAEYVDTRGLAHKLFYLFATAELVLQSSRYFLEKGRLQSSGIMGTLGQFLPEPFAGYVRIAGRYSIIYTTIVADAMVIVFVLGALAWWNGTGS